jgi:hypothetical protein
VSDLASVTCPAPGCDYGEDGGPAVLKATTMKKALRFRDDHIRSAHPGYKPPSGSLMSKVRHLD